MVSKVVLVGAATPVLVMQSLQACVPSLDIQPQ